MHDSRTCDRFEDALTSTKPLVSDFEIPSETMLVAFGGIAAGIGIPPFEFFRLIGGLPVKKLFVRDLEQAWYHCGLPGISDDLHGIAEYLAKLIADEEPRRTVFVGNSMGGYAAIVFGAMLNATIVHAFAPQTLLTKAARLMCLDRRWRAQIRKLHRAPRKDKHLFDLRQVVPRANSPTEFHVHYAALHRLDSIHAQQLRATRNVTLHSYPTAGHNLVKNLRETGLLRSILVQSLMPPIPLRRVA